MTTGELDALLALDGVSFELAPDVVVEFTVRRTDVTPERPHGISYAFVLRARAGGAPWLRFDNAHAVRGGGGPYRRRAAAFDHWHRTTRDPGRPYRFTTASRLLDDFWREVRRRLDEEGIRHDL